MKTFFIMMLLAVLSIGSFLSRPAKDDFDAFIAKSPSATVAPGLTFQDHFLWTSMDRDGKSAYVGVFNHWWGSDVIPSTVKNVTNAAKPLIK